MTNLIRAALRPRVVRPILVATAGTALLCIAFLLAISLSRVEIVVTPPAVIVSPPQVTVAPAPIVLPPTPVVVEAKPESPPPAPVPPPQPRALVPTLDPACVISTGTRPAICAWDDGFPAISADGTLIAIKYNPPTGPSDRYGLSIHFIDTKTSRVVRDRMILTLEESDSVADESLQDAAAQERLQRQRQRVTTTIYRRVAAVQQTLDAMHFRTLHLLGSGRTSMSDEQLPSERGPDPIYAEIAGSSARIIDSTASQVLWRGEFWVQDLDRKDRSSDCAGWTPWSITLWWDPETRHVLAVQTYRTGGCMCPDVPVESVRRMH